MKTKFTLITLFVACTFVLFAQEPLTSKDSLKIEIEEKSNSADASTNYTNSNKWDDSKPIKVAIQTDVSFTSSTNDTRKESSSGTGTLGLNIIHRMMYGSVRFTVHSQNPSIITDSNETKIFGTNLLIPQNSSSNISNFSLQMGVKSFFNYDRVSDNEPIMSWSRFGAFGYFNINNTTWTKDSLSTPITITSFGIDLTYLLLNLKVMGTEDMIRFYLSYGFTARRLGGDYALNSSEEMRTAFLSTSKLGFNGSNLSARLEIGKFYGQMNLTTFGRSRNIPGFSGNQALVTLGVKAELNLATQPQRAR